jgi:hypothetical protein
MHQHKVEPPPETSSSQPIQKRKLPLALIIVFIVLCCFAVVFVFFVLRTEETSGTVEQVYWERSIAIEAIVPVEYSAWEDQIPTDAEVIRCDVEVRSIESEPVIGADEVCGTPYSVDTGSGYAEVVQDCEYHVYDSYCTFSVLEWRPVNSADLSGYDFNPVWPEPIIDNEQRLGAHTESYTIFFDTENGDYSYSVNSFETFQQFNIGSEWILELNALGGVVSVSK